MVFRLLFGYFFLLRQVKVSKKKATPLPLISCTCFAHSGMLGVFDLSVRPSKPHKPWFATELERCAPLNPQWAHMLGAAKGIESQNHVNAIGLS
ncbi:MAG TPA: hypothetical protein DCG63_12665 [Methylophilaceae bacterium]|nr:hypothetical protein [Methylophilaceae bacterium]